MPSTSTAISNNGYPRFSAPETPSPVQAPHRGAESAQEAPLRRAEREIIAAGQSRHCEKPVEVNGSGKAWHQSRGLPMCLRCAESARLYAVYRRIVRRERVSLGVEDLVAFARAWEESTLKRQDRVEDAARIMVREMSPL